MEKQKEKHDTLIEKIRQLEERNSYLEEMIYRLNNTLSKIEEPKFVPYQVCPLCNGAHDICDVCKGEKIIPMKVL